MIKIDNGHLNKHAAKKRRQYSIELKNPTKAYRNEKKIWKTKRHTAPTVRNPALERLCQTYARLRDVRRNAPRLRDIYLKHLALQRVSSLGNRSGPLDIEKQIKVMRARGKMKYSFERLKRILGKQHNGGLTKIIDTNCSPPSEIHGHSDLVSYLLKKHAFHYNQSEHSPMGEEG